MPAPQTPFELSGKTTWTPLAEEQAYVDSLLAYAGAKLRYEVAGQSVNGNPMRVFRIGTGPRRMMFTSLIHGNEPASREVMYTLLRQWVDRIDTDSVFRDYLSKVTVLVMPTCSPDTLTSRTGASGVNVNRDFMHLRAPETRTILSVYRQFQPELVVDWHEFHGSYAEYSPAPAQNVNADSRLTPLAEDLFAVAHAAVQGQGWSSSRYGIEKGPDWFINNALLQGAVTVLMETSTVLTPAQRHEMHLFSAGTIQQWHADHMNAVRDAVEATRAEAASRTGPITLEAGGVTSPAVVDPVPGGYFLTINKWLASEGHRSRYGFWGEQAASGYYLPTAQPNRTLLAYTYDPSSPYVVTAGEPMDDAPVSPEPVPIGRNVSYFFRAGGRTRPATLKMKP